MRGNPVSQYEKDRRTFQNITGFVLSVNGLLELGLAVVLVPVLATRLHKLPRTRCL
ncbi:MAG: hypothetical protein LBH95_09680 [Oscillospiraceae bacterium]|jgi:hypothetical protein|nr:hypothetical protein [Oscillospiraceae bacterium]